MVVVSNLVILTKIGLGGRAVSHLYIPLSFFYLWALENWS